MTARVTVVDLETRSDSTSRLFVGERQITRPEKMHPAEEFYGYRRACCGDKDLCPGGVATTREKVCLAFRQQPEPRW